MSDVTGQPNEEQPFQPATEGGTEVQLTGSVADEVHPIEDERAVEESAPAVRQESGASGEPLSSAPEAIEEAQAGSVEKVALVWDDRLWRDGFGPRHPLRPGRLLRFIRLMESSGALQWRESEVVPVDPIGLDVLTDYHTSEYVQTVRALSEGATVVLRPEVYGFGPTQTLITPGFLTGHMTHVAASLTAARLVRDGVVSRAFTPAGGFHHARPGEARVGHVLNDVILVIKTLLAADLKVAYIDLDATHADAVQDAFYDTDRVLTISLHEGPQFLFPGTGALSEIGEGAGKGYNVNLPFPPATRDEPYLWAFEEIVPPLLDRFGPDVVVIQIGLSAHFSEELTHLELTTHGLVSVLRRIRDLSARWVALGGGGLNLDIAARGWVLAYAIMAGREPALPRRLPRKYADRWGSGEFHDLPLPSQSRALEEYVWSTVRSEVAALQRNLFPIHGLQPSKPLPSVEFAPLPQMDTAADAAPLRFPASPPPRRPVSRPQRQQPPGPILPEPEDFEEESGLLDHEEPEAAPAADETAREGKRRRGRRGRRGGRGAKGAAGPSGRATQERSGESKGKPPSPPRADDSAESEGEKPKRRRRGGRRRRSGKKAE